MLEICLVGGLLCIWFCICVRIEMHCWIPFNGIKNLCAIIVFTTRPLFMWSISFGYLDSLPLQSPFCSCLFFFILIYLSRSLNSVRLLHLNGDWVKKIIERETIYEWMVCNFEFRHMDLFKCIDDFIRLIHIKRFVKTMIKGVCSI